MERGVFFVNSDTDQSNRYEPDKLEYGLTVTSGAELTGGAGADVDFDDWVHNGCVEYSGDYRFFIEAGKGGHAISQEYSSPGDAARGDFAPLMEQVFSKICIDNGSVNGGAGGNVIMGDAHPFSQTAITGYKNIDDFIAVDPSYYGQKSYYSSINDRIRLQQGNGGDGIFFAAGRKYITIGQNSSVIGGSGGKIDYGANGEKVNTIPNGWNISNYNNNLPTYNRGAGGAGISGWGDLGLTNKDAALSDDRSDSNFWESKTKQSDDTGLYVAGTICGWIDRSWR